MSERAQALEALHKEIDWMLGGVGGTDSLTISAAILMRWRRTLAPAEGVSPQPDVNAKLMIAFCDGLDGTELSEDDHVFVKACLTQAMDVVLPVEPTPEPPTCGARHQMTGIVCELPRGHAENHRGEDSHCSSQWPKDDPRPTGEPAPCVWRLDADLDEDLNQRGKPSCQPAKYDSEVYSPFFTTCHYCGHPLTVER